MKLKDGGGKELSEADAKKKLKNQKKRAEKRRKLKEKKSGSKQQAEEDVPVKAPSREEQLRCLFLLPLLYYSPDAMIDWRWRRRECCGSSCLRRCRQGTRGLRS